MKIMNSEILSLRNVSKTYKTQGEDVNALKNVSFSIVSGEFVAIMGPSGSGKSTLLHIIGLLDRQTAGDVKFIDEETINFTDENLAKIRNQKIGFVFQAFNLLPRETVYDNVKMPLIYSKVPEKNWHEKILKAIDSVGLSHRTDIATMKLSGGEKQRTAIARALVCEPEIIFADEPTGNLDSKSGTQVMAIFDKLNSEGKTVVLITHEHGTASYARRVISMRDGQLVSDVEQESRKDNIK
jgi:putative ABC transport system ATP-binding protein